MFIGKRAVARTLSVSAVFLAFFVTSLAAGKAYMSIRAIFASGNIAITSVEGSTITSSNNPGGYANNQRSITPSTGNRYSPAFVSGANSHNIYVNINNGPDLVSSANAAKVSKIDMGTSTGCFLSAEDDWLWCANSGIPDGSTESSYSYAARPISRGDIPLSERIVDFSIGSQRGCLITDEGNIYCWGRNDSSSRLGTADIVSYVSEPHRVLLGEIPAHEKFQYVYAGPSVSCAITTSGTPYCWGLAGYLGDGTNTKADSPRKVLTQSDGGVMPDTVTKIIGSTGISTCAIASDGGIYCWGNNSRGQLGDNTTTSRYAPSRIYGLDNYKFTDVTTNQSAAFCALTDAGEVYCWGDNSTGQLGNGTTNSTSVPIKVQSDVVFASLGGGGGGTNGAGSMCAITLDGSPYCWGHNNGIDSGVNYVPAKIPTQSDGGVMPDKVSQIVAGAGSNSTCAITAGEQELYCWYYYPYSAQTQPFTGYLRNVSLMTPTRVIQFDAGLPEVSISRGSNSKGCEYLGFTDTTASTITCMVNVVSSMEEGLYDVTVADPRSSTTSTLPQALLVIPRTTRVTSVSATGKNESISLTWDYEFSKPYLSNYRPPVEVQCKRSSSNTWTSPTSHSCDTGLAGVNWGISSSYEMPNVADIVGLQNGVSYDVRIRARTEGEWNYSYGIITQASSFVPSPPTITDFDNFTISWSKPVNDGGSPVSRYMLLIQGGGASGWGAQHLWRGDNLASYVSINNNSEQPTKVYVVAINENGASAPSNIMDIYPVSADQPPGVPSNLKLNTTNTDQVLAAWSRPPANGTLSEYLVRYSLDYTMETGVGTCTSSGSPPSPSCLTSPLTIGDTYYFQVRATNQNGDGAWSIIHAAIVGSPDRPVITNITSGDAVASISWNVPSDNGATISDYSIEQSLYPDFPDSADTQEFILRPDDCTSGTCSLGFSGLTNGIAYYYRVSAVNSRGASNWSDIATAMPYAPPEISGVVPPASGLTSGYQLVTINGDNFNGATSIKIGGSHCLTFIVSDVNTAVCLTPPGTAGVTDIEITNLGGTHLYPDSFTYIQAPELTGISPWFGPVSGGQTVVISGRELGNVAEVKLGSSTCANLEIISNTEITCVTPASEVAETVAAQVSVPAGTVTLQSAYTYLSAPYVSSANPNFGSTAGGTEILIGGYLFDHITDVQVGGTPCIEWRVLSISQISCTTPAHSAGPVGVTVTGVGGSTVGGVFTYTDPPSITSISPAAGAVTGGDLVIIEGSGFSSPMNIVVGGASCAEVTVISSTEATCRTPVQSAGGGYELIVQTSVGSSNSMNYFYYAYLEVSAADLDLGTILPSARGEYYYDFHSVSVATDNPTGYALSVSTLDGHMNHAAGGSFFNKTENACSNYDNLLSTPPSAILPDTWGLTTNSSDATAQKLCGVGTDPLQLRLSSIPALIDNPDETTVYFGVKPSLENPPGSYSLKVTYTVVPAI